MADNADSEVINLYQPKKRFLIPINNFHVPKKLFKLMTYNATQLLATDILVLATMKNAAKCDT